MQIKTTKRYHLSPARIAIIKKFTNNKCWRGCGKKGTLLHCCGNANLYSHYEEQYGSLLKKKKKKTELPYDPKISFLGIHLEKI